MNIWRKLRRRKPIQEFPPPPTVTKSVIAGEPIKAGDFLVWKRRRFSRQWKVYRADNSRSLRKSGAGVAAHDAEKGQQAEIVISGVIRVKKP